MARYSGSLTPHGTLSGGLSNAANVLSGTISSDHVSIKDKHFAYVQSTASATWDIEHPLNKFPSVTVVDSAGSVVVGEVQYISNSEVIVTFNGAVSGTAYLN